MDLFKSVERFLDNLDQTAATKIGNLKNDTPPPSSPILSETPPSPSFPSLGETDKQKFSRRKREQPKKPSKKVVAPLLPPPPPIPPTPEVSTVTPPSLEVPRPVDQIEPQTDNLSREFETLEEQFETEPNTITPEKEEIATDDGPLDPPVETDKEPNVDIDKMEELEEEPEEEPQEEEEEEEEADEDKEEKDLLLSENSRLETENRLLRNQAQSLAQELSGSNQRIRSLQAYLDETVANLHDAQRENSEKEKQLMKFLKSGNDFEAALNAKDSQQASLYTQLQEAHQNLKSREVLIASLQESNNKLTQHKEKMEKQALQRAEQNQEKVKSLENLLQTEQQLLNSTKTQNQERERLLQSNLTELSETLSISQRALEERSAEIQRLTTRMKGLKNEMKDQQKEFSDYKRRANTVLEAKDKTIGELTEQLSNPDATNSKTTELHNNFSQSQDQLKAALEQLDQATSTIEHLEFTIQELKHRQEIELSEFKDQLLAVERSLQSEKKLSSSLQEDVLFHKKELANLHEISESTSSSLKNRCEQKEQELKKLKRQLSTKAATPPLQMELETQLRTLTEHLLQKQSQLDTLACEKDALLFRIEQQENASRKLNQHQLAISIQNEPTERDKSEDHHGSRMRSLTSLAPHFMSQKSWLSQKTLDAANLLDSISLQTAKNLSRTPQLRLALTLYAVVLHCWVLSVFFSWTPATPSA
eukprot:TRINITY_DN383_c2_g1_i1.p1 TRINITY_DN383_c2_g1~~TRINITY_DN383_c2_g1_i1.p1  ORF type:complete len:706 (+),score=256.92 TRINITY_DN383_c2_g1_i1:55-2172(+)